MRMPYLQAHRCDWCRTNSRLTLLHCSLSKRQRVPLCTFQRLRGRFYSQTKYRTIVSWNECGCSPNYTYYRNITSLVSDYPPINIQVGIAKYDSIHSVFTIVAQNSGFDYLPVDTFFTASNGDSMLINNRYYNDVFVLRNDDTYNASILFADSIYYNKQHGLLKLFMHNGENYTIYP